MAAVAARLRSVGSGETKIVESSTEMVLGEDERVTWDFD